MIINTFPTTDKELLEKNDEIKVEIGQVSEMIIEVLPEDTDRISQASTNNVIEESNNIDIGSTTFYELINVDKLKNIINHYNTFESIIKEQGKDVRRKDKNYNAFTVFQKILNNVCSIYEYKNIQYGYIKVTYNKGRNSNEIGRWYCNKGIGLQPLNHLC